MFVTIINDCNDENALGRQATRVSSKFNCNVTTIGINNDIEAAGNLIDALDAAESENGVILVNVAPRSSHWSRNVNNNGNGKSWRNGTPFASFKYKNVTVISTIDGYTLSLVKKLQLVEEVNLFNIPDVTKHLVEKGEISKQKAEQINNTQFRSYNFSPRVAYWIHKGLKLPSNNYPIEEIKDIPPIIWWIDNFGNCKTTLLRNELTIKNNQVKTNFGTYSFFERLSEVGDGNSALIEGSSGIEDKQFIELVVQGNAANEILKIEVGTKLL